jgi:hypothetical protein
MKPLKPLAALAAIYAAFLGVKELMRRYKFGFYYIDRQLLEDDSLEVESMDLRGTPTHLCICGSDVFDLRVTFDDYEIATYMLDMVCANCGSLATAPTPLDKEAM